jgi:ankyrin repeat protein
MLDLPELTGGSLAIARALLDAGAESEYGSLYSVLVEAIRASHPRLVRLLLERGAATIAGPEKWLKPGCELSMQTALMEAVACNEIECVRLLLAQGADPNHGCTGFPPTKDGRLPVDAVIEGFYAGFRYGLANPTAHRGGPLHVAVIAGNLRLFRLLLRHGADPDVIPGLNEYVACLSPETLRRRFESSIDAQRRANAVRHALPPESTEQKGSGCR